MLLRALRVAAGEAGPCKIVRLPADSAVARYGLLIVALAIPGKPPTPTVPPMPTVKDLMTTDVIFVDPDDSVEKVMSLLLKHRVSGLPVADSAGRLLGLISEFDLLELVWDPTTSQDKVYQYMSRQVHSVSEDADLDALAESFRILAIRRMPVVRDDRLVGIISRHDLLRYVLQARGRVAPVIPRPLYAPDAPMGAHI